MKSYKVLLGALLLCVSQLSFAVATPAQLASLDNALAAVALDVNNQASADAAVQAAANADIAEADIVTRLFNLGVPEQVIRNAMSKNLSVSVLGGGVQAACSPRCGSDHLLDVSYTNEATKITDTTLALLGAGGATGAGGVTGAGGTAGGGFPAVSGGPSGAVSPN